MCSGKEKNSPHSCSTIGKPATDPAGARTHKPSERTSCYVSSAGEAGLLHPTLTRLVKARRMTSCPFTVLVLRRGHHLAPMFSHSSRVPSWPGCPPPGANHNSRSSCTCSFGACSIQIPLPQVAAHSHTQGTFPLECLVLRSAALMSPSHWLPSARGSVSTHVQHEQVVCGSHFPCCSEAEAALISEQQPLRTASPQPQCPLRCVHCTLLVGFTHDAHRG